MSGFGVWSNILGVMLFEQLQDFAGLGVSACSGFRIERITIDGHIKDPFVASCERQGLNDVLIIGQQVCCRAHGAG